jgi:hypothetical protein
MSRWRGGGEREECNPAPFPPPARLVPDARGSKRLRGSNHPEGTAHGAPHGAPAGVGTRGRGHRCALPPATEGSYPNRLATEPRRSVARSHPKRRMRKAAATAFVLMWRIIEEGEQVGPPTPTRTTAATMTAKSPRSYSLDRWRVPSRASPSGPAWRGRHRWRSSCASVPPGVAARQAVRVTPATVPGPIPSCDRGARPLALPPLRGLP